MHYFYKKNTFIFIDTSTYLQLNIKRISNLTCNINRVVSVMKQMNCSIEGSIFRDVSIPTNYRKVIKICTRTLSKFIAIIL